MANPLYPDVPQTPGVPAVLRDASNPGGVSTGAPLKTDSTAVTSSSAVKWGIFKPGGEVALKCDSVFSLEPRREFRVPDYTLENGGFAQYNKVATPGENRITVTKGGSDSDRQGFLDALDRLIESLDLVNIVTPDSSFLDRNAVSYDYTRTSQNGMTLLRVEIQFIEIRQTATVQFADSKQPSGSPTANVGPVQAVPTNVKEMPAGAVPASTNPAIEAIPVLNSDATTAEKAATVSSVIQNGGSIGDLVNKGVAFQTIPLLSRASQSLTTTLGGQSVRLNIAQRATGLFADLYSNNALVVAGVKVENNNPIVRSSYLGFAGDLFFHDTQDADLDDVDFKQLGGRYALLYAGA